jgi:hypothetical protein
LAEARCRSPSSAPVVGDDDDDSFDAFVLVVLCDCLNCEPCFAKRRDDDDDDDALVEHGSSARRVSMSDDGSASASKVFQPCASLVNTSRERVISSEESLGRVRHRQVII